MPSLRDAQRLRQRPGKEDVPPPSLVQLLQHVKSLTSELTSHEELLAELYGSHLRDRSALAETGAKVIGLRQTVKGLDGEVAALRALLLAKGWAGGNPPPLRAADGSAANLTISYSESRPRQPEEPGRSFEPLSIDDSRADTDQATLGSPASSMPSNRLFASGIDPHIATQLGSHGESVARAAFTHSSHTEAEFSPDRFRRSPASCAISEPPHSTLLTIRSLVTLATAEITLFRVENNRMRTELASLIRKKNTEVTELQTARKELKTAREYSVTQSLRLLSYNGRCFSPAVGALGAQVARLETERKSKFPVICLANILAVTTETTKNQRIRTAAAEASGPPP
ncbi:hypothetical protein B0H11DRAFT_1989969 [Mycena galericulata]|nr:hypothetical protein B0H11DRAFT_1989969 [Mycena galericulata]